MRVMAIVFVLFCNIACQSLYKNVESYIYQLPVGSVLILHQSINIPPHQTGIYFQYGTIQTYRNIEVYEANCKFEVRDLVGEMQMIDPDQFEIYKVQQESESVGLDLMQFASRVSIYSGGGATAEVYATVLYLRSRRQPNVLKLTCEHWDDPALGDDLKITQLMAALGDYLSVEIAQ